MSKKNIIPPPFKGRVADIEIHDKKIEFEDKLNEVMLQKIQLEVDIEELRNELALITSDVMNEKNEYFRLKRKSEKEKRSYELLKEEIAEDIKKGREEREGLVNVEKSLLRLESNKEKIEIQITNLLSEREKSELDLKDVRNEYRLERKSLFELEEKIKTRREEFGSLESKVLDYRSKREREKDLSKEISLDLKKIKKNIFHKKNTLKSMEEKYDEINEKLYQKEEECSETEEKLVFLESEVSAREEERGSILREITKLSSDLEKIGISKKELVEKKIEVEKKVKKIRIEHVEAIRSLKDSKVELGNENSKIILSKTILKDLELEKEKAGRDVRNHEERIQGLLEREEELRNSINFLNESKEKSIEEKKCLDKELSIVRNVFREENLAFNQLLKRKDLLNEEFYVAKLERDDVQRSLKVEREKKEEILVKRNEAQKRTDDICAIIKDQEGQIILNKEKVKSLNMQLNKLNEDKDDLKREVKDLKRDKVEIKNDIEKITADKELVTQQREEVEKEYKKRKEDLDTFIKANEEYMAKVERSRSKEVEELNNIQNEVCKSKEEVNNIENVIRTKFEEVQKVENEIFEKRKECERLSNVRDNLKNEINLENDKALLIKESIKKYEKENDDIKKNVNESNEELNKVKKNIDEVSEGINSKLESEDELVQRLRALEEEVTFKEKKLEQLEFNNLKTFEDKKNLEQSVESLGLHRELLLKEIDGFESQIVNKVSPLIKSTLKRKFDDIWMSKNDENLLSSTLLEIEKDFKGLLKDTRRNYEDEVENEESGKNLFKKVKNINFFVPASCVAALILVTIVFINSYDSKRLEAKNERKSKESVQRSIASVSKKEVIRNDEETPKVDTIFRDTIVDNVLHYRDYLKIVDSDEFNNRWIRALNNFLIKEIDQSDDTIFIVTSLEKDVIYELSAQKSNMTSDDYKAHISQMKKTELEFNNKLIKAFGGKEGFLKYVNFRNEFFKNFVSSK